MIILLHSGSLLCALIIYLSQGLKWHALKCSTVHHCCIGPHAEQMKLLESFFNKMHITSNYNSLILFSNLSTYCTFTRELYIFLTSFIKQYSCFYLLVLALHLNLINYKRLTFGMQLTKHHEAFYFNS